jgi:glycosyltransferase involved in cell wall biosynthesis
VPLTDDEFNKGKSNLKWLENSARKIPTVASSVESYKVSIKHGETGFLANNQDEWVEHLSHLIENKTLRTRIGQQAYDEVKKNYNIETQVYKWANAYREVLANYKKKEADYGKEKLMDTGCNQPRTQGVIA